MLSRPFPKPLTLPQIALPDVEKLGEVEQILKSNLAVSKK